jgi:hypothetical protein
MSRSPFVALSAVLLFATANPADAARSIVDRNYDCKIIASTREFPGGPDWLGPPAMNAWGQVVFEAFTTVGVDTVQELRVGRGDQVSGVPTSHVVAKGGQNFQGPLAPFGSIEEGAIDDTARVTFLAYLPSSTGGGQGIYRVLTNHPATVKPDPLFADQNIDLTSPYLGFDPLDTLQSNRAGSVLFQGITDTGVAYFRDDIEVARNYSSGIQIVNAPVLLHADRPWTAFLASLDIPLGGQGLWVNGVQLAASQTGAGGLAVGGFAGLSLSGNGTAVVAYSRSGFPDIDTWELVTTSTLGTNVLVDADVDPFERSGAPLDTSINVWGEVAFISSPIGDGDTLLVADGSQQISRVNCQNQDAIFGASFFDLVLSPHGINADGQIAFEGKTSAHRFLVRADPLPGQGAPPTSCAGQLEGARCDDGDPITQSSCQAGVCRGNPLYDPPTSCIGSANHAACNDGDPATISTCEDGVCVGIPLPVPEPTATSLVIAALFGLASLRRARSTR